MWRAHRSIWIDRATRLGSVGYGIQPGGSSMFKKMMVAGVCAAMVSGCASTSDKISATYVSPLTYANYDCDQIRMELTRVSSKVQEVAGAQNKQAKNDQVAMGVGLVLFWPALFFLAGSDKKDELANLKGQYDGLSAAAIEKKCPVATEMKKM